MKNGTIAIMSVLVFFVVSSSDLRAQNIYKTYDENGVPVYSDTGVGDPHEVRINNTPVDNSPTENYSGSKSGVDKTERDKYTFFSIESLLIEADRYFQNDEFEEAAEVYTYILNKTDDQTLYPFLYYSRGNCYYNIIIFTIFESGEDYKLKKKGIITDSEYEKRRLENERAIYRNEIKAYSDLTRACDLGERRGCEILESYPF
jgi:hypothetical protein